MVTFGPRVPALYFILLGCWMIPFVAQEEFVDQIDRIKNAYDAERIELEKRLRLLQTEVTDERQMRKEVEGERSKGGQRVEELNMALSSLRKQNYQVAYLLIKALIIY